MVNSNVTIRTAFNIKFAIVVILFFAAAIALRADTITVTNTNDSGPGSLRQVLADANDGDTIDFAVTGTIGLTSGELLVDTSITISGPGADNLAVNGSATSRVFYIVSDKIVAITGLTITNGMACCFFPDDVGGGIYNDHATLTLNSCIISGNIGDRLGGGIFTDGSSGFASVTITDSILVDNSSFSGGAIFNSGQSGSATLEITTTVVSGNSVIEAGGGIYNDHAHVTLDSCTVSGNSADGNGGGGIYNSGLNEGSATLGISSSTLSGNSSQFNGGAIYNIGDSSGTANVQISNSTFSGNSANNFGGAVYNHGTLGTAIVQIGNSTLSDNSAQSSGDSIYNFVQQGFTGDVVASFANTIFKASTSGDFFNNGGTITSQGYNLSSDDGGGFLNAPGDQINANPLLGPLQDNGGPTLTRRPFPGSPAIDAGDPNFTPPPSFDQRGPGFDRVVNGRIDIGSFEVQNGKPTPTPTPRPIPTPRPRPTPRLRPTPR